MTTAERIRAMLVKDYKLSPDQLTDDALLVDLGIDSIGMAELIFTMEDEFGLTTVSYTHLDVYKRQGYTRHPATGPAGPASGSTRHPAAGTAAPAGTRGG